MEPCMKKQTPHKQQLKSFVFNKKLGTLLFFFFRILQATDNCTPAQLSADSLFNEAFERNGFPQLTGDVTQDRLILKNRRSNRRSFYNDYISKYYPKAFVVRINFFLNMSPTEIEKALGDIVALLTTDPWFYFVNNKHEINITHYWEYIIDQLRILNDFLINAVIDKKSQKICMPKDYDAQKVLDSELFFADTIGNMNENKNDETTPLLEQLITCGTASYDFYALCFDYLIKLFNEKILCDELSEAHIYFYDLEELVTKLQGCPYEITYQEHLKTAKELVEMLKTRREEQKTKGNVLHKDPKVAS